MGCCMSTKQPPSKKSDQCGGAPPLLPPQLPPQVEEETVKEVVLSETPIPKPAPPKVVEEKSNRYEVPENHELKKIEVESTAEIKRPEEPTIVIKPTEDVISEASEHSELCTFTESFSTTTTATVPGMEKRDDGEEVTQRSPVRIRRKRPDGGDFTGARERGSRSPARRYNPSPETRKPVASSRPGQGRAMGSQRRNIGAGTPNNTRRDPSEGPVRRSRSPATRGQMGSRLNVRYRSPGLSENGRSAGGRSPARALDSGVKLEKSNDDVLSESSKLEKPNDGVLDETSESLENPLVSLECFIFL